MELYSLITISYIFLSYIVAYYYRKSKFRYFFFLGAFSDTIGMIFWLVFSVSGQSLWIPFHYLLIFSVSEKVVKRWFRWILIGLFPIIILNFYSTTSTQYYFVFISNLIILFLFLKYFIEGLLRNEEINIFFITMIFYETIILLKFLAIIRKVEVGVNVFFAGIFIQIVINIVLIIVRDRDTILLKKKK